MKKNRSLRSMIFFLAVVLIIPILCFTLYLQVQTWRTMKHNLQRELEGELNTANHMLEMVIDKYDMVLYDFCTDDEIIELVEQINESEKPSDAVKYQIRRSLAHICNRNAGVEGITLITESGTVCFYDKEAASFVSTKWANKIPKVDMRHRMSVYQRSVYVLGTESQPVHMLQLTRRLADYRNINRQIGTVVLSVNQSVLWDDIQVSDKSTVYVCESDQIIAAADPAQIGKRISAKSQRDYRVLEAKNDKTGWDLYHFYSKVQYDQQIKANICIGLGSMVALMLFSTVLVTFMMRPVLDLVGRLVYAMSEIENGNFDVQIPSVEHPTNEVERIVAGFNEMSGQLKQLVEKVKQSTVDQKNAELQAMEAQIDPHFLYNTLDTIIWLAESDEQKQVVHMVESLSDFFRTSLNQGKDIISIKEEIQHVRSYLEIQQMRYQDILEYEINVPEEFHQNMIPKITVQPLVENALYHGIKNKRGKGKITVRGYREGSFFILEVQDNGIGMQPERLEQVRNALVHKQFVESKVYGLYNVNERIRLNCGEEYGLRISSTYQEGTTVKIFLPDADSGLTSPEEEIQPDS